MPVLYSDRHHQHRQDGDHRLTELYPAEADLRRGSTPQTTLRHCCGADRQHAQCHGGHHGAEQQPGRAGHGTQLGPLGVHGGLSQRPAGGTTTVASASAPRAQAHSTAKPAHGLSGKYPSAGV